MIATMLVARLGIMMTGRKILTLSDVCDADKDHHMPWYQCNRKYSEHAKITDDSSLTMRASPSA